MKKLLILVLALCSLMTTSTWAAKLANREILQAQLESVTTQDGFVENFIQFILAFAESEKQPEQLVEIFTEIKRTIVDQLLESSPILGLIEEIRFNALIPLCIKAILPDNDEEATIAIESWKAIRQPSLE